MAQLYLGQELGGYRLEAQLGRGGFATVLRARRVSDGALAALKVLRAKHLGQQRAERRLLREARLVAGLRHPRVVSALDHGRDGPWVYFAMRLAPGEVLSRTLLGGALPWVEVVEIGLQVCDALAYLHGKGMVHQDVKPDNLVRSSRGEVCLVDFGLALTREEVLVGRTGVGPDRITGTGSYRAPEQSDPQGRVSAATDLYGLGVTLHRLASARLPSEGLLADPEPAALLAPCLAACLAEDPRARPSARALRAELARLLG